MLTECKSFDKMIVTEDNKMENRIPVDFKLVPVVFFEAKIIRKDTEQVFETITKKHLGELQSDVNIWLKCGKYSLLSVERVERPQIQLS